MALAIDNARWFGRLRTVGADEERTRIARDLHDRIGQSLAYLAFELDRIVARDEQGEALGPSLEQLRDDVRSVIREVRDTLYDLRTDVSDSQDMAATLEAYIARVQDRSKLSRRAVLRPRARGSRSCRSARCGASPRRRSPTSSATPRPPGPGCSGAATARSAALEITDNGQGFPIGKAGRLDSYGILGMRERASSIGATLELSSEVGRGTRVRCSLIQSTDDERRRRRRWRRADERFRERPAMPIRGPEPR